MKIYDRRQRHQKLAAMINKLKRLIQTKNAQLNKLEELLTPNDMKSPKINLGQIQSEMNRGKTTTNINEVEFQVFSQFGDDGIIQYLTQKIETPKTFIEFGVENYREANTRFLLIKDHWRGMVIDGSEDNVRQIVNDPVSWANDLQAECAFITRDNINSLLRLSGFDAEIGILSIDIDGNDYYVWEAITEVNPVIVIAEYNGTFGRNTTWSIKYEPDFVRQFPWMYWGCSLGALNYLAERKGYSLIGCNMQGNNCYFIRNDKLGPFKKLTVDEAFKEPTYREAIIDGRRVSGRAKIKLIEGMEIVEVVTGKTYRIRHDFVKY